MVGIFQQQKKIFVWKTFKESKLPILGAPESHRSAPNIVRRINLEEAKKVIMDYIMRKHEIKIEEEL